MARLPPETEGQAKKKEVGENGKEKKANVDNTPALRLL